MCAFILPSCAKKQDGNVLSRSFQGETWGRFDYLNASYNVVSPMTADVVMELEVSEVFPNIYPYHADDNGMFAFVMSVNAPDGSRRAREYRFMLKDEEGKFKAENKNGYYHYELPLLSEMSFDANGEYTFKLENKYPRDPLYGIRSLNIKCMQIKKKK